MSLFDELNQSMVEAIDYAKGDNRKARIKSVFIEEVPLLNKADVKAIRTNLRMTKKLCSDRRCITKNSCGLGKRKK